MKFHAKQNSTGIHSEQDSTETHSKEISTEIRDFNRFMKSTISTDSSRIDCQFCGVEVSKKSIRRHEVYKQCLQNWERQPTENNQKRSEDILVPPISKQEQMFSSRDWFADYVYLTKNEQKCNLL